MVSGGGRRPGGASWRRAAAWPPERLGKETLRRWGTAPPSRHDAGQVPVTGLAEKLGRGTGDLGEAPAPLVCRRLRKRCFGSGKRDDVGLVHVVPADSLGPVLLPGRGRGRAGVISDPGPPVLVPPGDLRWRFGTRRCPQPGRDCGVRVDFAEGTVLTGLFVIQPVAAGRPPGALGAAPWRGTWRMALRGAGGTLFVPSASFPSTCMRTFRFFVTTYLVRQAVAETSL